MGKGNTKDNPELNSTLDKRLEAMNKRVGREGDGSEKSEPSRPRNEGFGNAFKLSSEFISAILVGAAMGYGIDWLVGTSPWAMILFLLLGFVAGVMNVLRASGEMSGSYELDASNRNRSSQDKD